MYRKRAPKTSSVAQGDPMFERPGDLTPFAVCGEVRVHCFIVGRASHGPPSPQSFFARRQACEGVALVGPTRQVGQ
jgi:hypothetical protein